MPLRSSLLITLCLLCPAMALGQTGLLGLTIGDPGRRDHELGVRLDTIVDTTRGESMSPQALAERLEHSRLVLVGEQHTDAAYHAVQLHVLELLQARGATLSIGLEMFPVDRQATLDTWIAGGMEEGEFVEASDWYRIWGYNWGYYRDIFLFARAHAIPMIALNEPADTSTDAEPPPPAPDLASEDHRRLLHAFFAADSPIHGGLGPEQFDALFAAQCARDATMARNLVHALAADAERTLVVLAGTGHVLYELGIVRQLPESARRAAATIVPVPVETGETSVQASVADFVWGVPESDYPRFPELGVITTPTDGGLRVIHVEADSPAHRAGLEVGDVLTHVATEALVEKRDLSRALAAVRWGDQIVVGLTRDTRPMKLTLWFRREPAAPDADGL